MVANAVQHFLLTVKISDAEKALSIQIDTKCLYPPKEGLGTPCDSTNALSSDCHKTMYKASKMKQSNPVTVISNETKQPSRIHHCERSKSSF